MHLKDLDKYTGQTRTVFQRRNGRLRILQVPDSNKNSEQQQPMFPINKERDTNGE
jgi:hypothetical protein